jgi:hypothetical protein
MKSHGSSEPIEGGEGMGEAMDLAESRSLLERSEVRRRVERARVRLEDLDAHLRRVVYDQPLLAVGTALLSGYLVGRLWARR